MLPGAVAEDGELLTEPLVRQVRDETGTGVLAIGRLAWVAEFDNPMPQRLHEALGPGEGYTATTFVFEVEGWRGQTGSADPDGLVAEAWLLPLTEMLDRLGSVAFRVMREPTVAYLRSRVAVGAVRSYRREADGSDRLIALLQV